MNVRNVLVIGVYHVLFLVLTPWYFITQQFNWGLFFIAIILYALCCIAITAGYHRLYSHKAYKLHWSAEFIVLFFATLAMQGSAIKWAHDHRNHHTHLDTEKDPYSITKGFWHAHMGWLFKPDVPIDKKLVGDLYKNPLLVFQHRYYGLLVIVTHLLLFSHAYLFSADLFGTIYLVILLRMILIHHCTWFINSLAHTIGSKTYSRELTAVDNLILAFLTFGEGYHNFHHTFMSDYRNGIRWYHFDPTKWLVWFFSRVGLASKLKRTDSNVIRKKLINHDMKHFSQNELLLSAEIYKNLLQIQASYERALSEMQVQFHEYMRLRSQRASKNERRRVRIVLKQKRRELHAYWKAWVYHVKCVERNFSLPHL